MKQHTETYFTSDSHPNEKWSTEEQARDQDLRIAWTKYAKTTSPQVENLKTLRKYVNELLSHLDPGTVWDYTLPSLKSTAEPPVGIGDVVGKDPPVRQRIDGKGVIYLDKNGVHHDTFAACNSANLAIERKARDARAYLSGTGPLQLHPRSYIFAEITDERLRQDKLKAEGKFEFTCADPAMHEMERLSVLAEEFGEVAHEVNEGIGGRAVDYTKLRTELIQTAAVCVAWLEFLSKRTGTP